MALHPVTPIENILREEIAANGPISFERFMELALYDSTWGYYCRGPKPVGAHGDFFTASQFQPVYGLLIGQYVERLARDHSLALPKVFRDYGAGRGEMQECLSGWEYRAIEVHSPLEAGPMEGVVFGNELFDALPVKSAVCLGSQFFEQRVGWNGDRFVWTLAGRPSEEIAAYAAHAGAPHEEGFQFEVHHRGMALLRDLLERATNLLCVFLDYGYSQRDWIRFPAGTLMSYRRHRADPDVLAHPGEQDITSHVPFHLLAATAQAAGARLLRMERMGNALLYAGETDSFHAVLNGGAERECFERRQQLKSLLYGLGESFHCIAIAR